jgi:hypothetical protein
MGTSARISVAEWIFTRVCCVCVGAQQGRTYADGDAHEEGGQPARLGARRRGVVDEGRRERTKRRLTETNLLRRKKQCVALRHTATCPLLSAPSRARTAPPQPRMRRVCAVCVRAHQAAEEEEGAKRVGRGATGGGEHPCAQAERDDAEGVVVLGRLRKERRAKQEAHLRARVVCTQNTHENVEQRVTRQPYGRHPVLRRTRRAHAAAEASNIRCVSCVLHAP